MKKRKSVWLNNISQARKKVCRNNEESGICANGDSSESIPSIGIKEITIERSNINDELRATDNVESFVSACLDSDTDQLSCLSQVDYSDEILDLLSLDDLENVGGESSKMNHNIEMNSNNRLCESNENPLIASADNDQIFQDALFRLAVSLKQSEASRLELLRHIRINNQM